MQRIICLTQHCVVVVEGREAMGQGGYNPLGVKDQNLF